MRCYHEILGSGKINDSSGGGCVIRNLADGVNALEIIQ
jgi:hypothetical protein